MQRKLIIEEFLSAGTANHYSDSSCLNNIPMFGKNTIRSDSDYNASAYKNDDGYYISLVARPEL